MPSELKNFQQDLLESVRQMKRGEAARATKVQLPAAAEARAQVGLSQQDFAHPEVLRKLHSDQEEAPLVSQVVPPITTSRAASAPAP